MSRKFYNYIPQTIRVHCEEGDRTLTATWQQVYKLSNQLFLSPLDDGKIKKDTKYFITKMEQTQNPHLIILPMLLFSITSGIDMTL